ncbi:MAG: hypothetical protein ACRCUY_06625 [Thermoguttaceae bacterium]
MERKQPFAGIRFLIFSITSIALGFPIAGALSGIVVYFSPAEWDEVAVGLNTMFLSFFVMFFLGIVFLVLGCLKGGKGTRMACCIFVTLGVMFVVGAWMAS